MDLVHYGAKSFDPTRFRTIERNGHHNKPLGGLWASPINSTWSWRDLCASSGYPWHNNDKYFEFRILGHIITIDSAQDLGLMPWLSPDAIDFMALIRQKIDAIYLTDRGELATRNSLPHNLCGWECESVVILNQRCIIL